MRSSAICLALLLVTWGPGAFAEDVYHPARKLLRHVGGNLITGAANCATIPGAFWDAVDKGSCWKCPSSAPRRTVFPVTTDKACVGPKPVPGSHCFTARVTNRLHCSGSRDFGILVYNEKDAVDMVTLADTQDSLDCDRGKSTRTVQLCPATAIVPGRKYQVVLQAITSSICTFESCQTVKESRIAKAPAAWDCTLDTRGESSGEVARLECKEGKP
jgi:hypothetical protein